MVTMAQSAVIWRNRHTHVDIYRYLVQNTQAMNIWLKVEVSLCTFLFVFKILMLSKS